MKNLAFICAAVAMFAACKKKETAATPEPTPQPPAAYAPDCSGGTPSYTASVNGIISTYCATSGCHGTGSSNGPGELITYTNVKNASSGIRTAVLNGSMPKNSTLSAAQKNTIICWIDAGAPNN